ncbi:hypothetical protein D0T12_18345 [Actinomadura spongiicola]|uniref:Uncharacterized protein n=1 Tax=Actinomadura spongiicola TaxID=2303421 RepID=A0A372GFJ1_9ACTN|nr:hypothetical protein D0T12_18345 [Actinomadura spongiicola]
MSPAQRAALDRARELQRVCRLCDGCETDEYGDPVPLGKGRVCGPCERVRRNYVLHLDSREFARVLREGLRAGTAVLAAVDNPARPQRLVMTGSALRLDVRLPSPNDPPPSGSPAAREKQAQETFASITRRLAGAGLPTDGMLTVICWQDAALIRRNLAGAFHLPQPSGWLAEHTWYSLDVWYGRWYAAPAKGVLDPLRFSHDWGVNPTDVGGDLADRVHALGLALDAMADDHPDTVSPGAPWITRPAAISDLHAQQRSR